MSMIQGMNSARARTLSISARRNAFPCSREVPVSASRHRIPTTIIPGVWSPARPNEECSVHRDQCNLYEDAETMTAEAGDMTG